jgi:uncharacterized protein (TIGR02147 family)
MGIGEKMNADAVNSAGENSVENSVETKTEKSIPSVSSAAAAAAASVFANSSLFSSTPPANVIPAKVPMAQALPEESVISASPAAIGGVNASGATGSVITNKMPALTEPPVIGNYLDFRKFLSDYYGYRREISKKDLRPYNYAVFSAAANIKSPNYLKLIIEGRRNLSEEMILKFAKAMSLPKDQTEDFRLLVLFGQASDPAERNMHLKALNEKRVDSKLKSGEIDQKTWEKIPSWISWILYSLIDQKDVKFEAESLRKTLREKASVDEIQAALDSLLQSGEIVRDEKSGEVKKARSLMESAEDVPVALVRKLQAELMYLGLESLFRDSATEREFGSATLALTKQEFDDLRFQLRKLRKDAQKNIGVKRLTTKGERVYQLNLQLFPVT